MARVNGNISDLFFNTEHHASYDEGQFVEHDHLSEEATDFLGCLHNLGVDCPTVDELIHDFRERL